MSATSEKMAEFPVKFEDELEPPTDTKFIISLVTPALFVFALAILFPIAVGIFISFTDSSGTTGYFGKTVSITNYYELLAYGNYNTRDFWQFTYQTLFFSAVSLVIELILGLVFALLLNKKFRGRGIARATLLIPWALPTIASSTLFRFEIFAPADTYGLINNLLELFYLTPIDFYGPDALVLFNLPILFPFPPYIGFLPIKTTMFTIIIIDVWKTTPFLTLLILAALQIVSEDLYKAAEVEGATGWQKFRYITWPLIKPGIGVAIVFRMMDALRVYDLNVVFNDKSVDSMTSQAVNLWFGGLWGLSAAVTVLLFLFILIFALIILKRTGREKRISFESKSRLPKFLKREKKDKNLILEKVEKESEPKIVMLSESKIAWFRRKRLIKKIFFYLMVVFMCVFCAAPFIWIILRSFRDPYVTQTEFELFPKVFNLRAYEVVFATSEFTGVSFDRALLNGFILSGLTVLIVIIIGSFLAYALAKFDFPMKPTLSTFIFFMTSLPPLIIAIPFFIQIKSIANVFPFFDIHDNLFGLLLPYTAFNLPLAVFVLRAFFAEIPEDLWKAAKVDGATNFQIFRKIILPLTIPGIFTCAILVFIASWNELLFAQLWLISDINHTVPRAILRFIRSPLSLQADWNTDIALMAATSIATIPLVILVLIFQKKIISGITSGAVKG
jgi:ABC-type glycerol-3-phosphate transport system permease component